MTDQDAGVPPKKAGRPTGKRGTFTFRVTTELREKLEASAKKAERPVSEVIESRLEHTYWEDEYGKTLAGVWTNVLISMSGSTETAQLVRDLCVLIDRIERDLGHKWPESDFARMVVGTALQGVISSRFAPSQDHPENEKSYAERNGQEYSSWMLNKLSTLQERD